MMAKSPESLENTDYFQGKIGFDTDLILTS